MNEEKSKGEKEEKGNNTLSAIVLIICISLSLLQKERV